MKGGVDDVIKLRIKACAAPALAGALLSALALGCGEPLGPLEAGWVKLGDVPADVSDVYGVLASREGPPPGGGEVYIAGRNTDGNGVIYFYKREKFSLDYETASGGAAIEDIAGTPHWPYWAGGHAGGKGPLLLKLSYAGEWKEKPLPPLRWKSICGVMPDPQRGEDMCWFLTTDHEERFYGKHAGVLGYYRYGDAMLFENLGQVTAVADFIYPYVWVFAVEYAGDNFHPRELGPGYNGRGKLYFTNNDGAAWREELLPAAIGGRVVRSAEALGTWRDNVLLLFYFEDGAVGIVMRAGGPAVGIYLPLFLANQAPYFHEMRAWAENARAEPYGISTDALAAGEMTTVVYDAGRWYMEALPYPLAFADVAPSRDPGFVGVARNIIFDGWELMYHP
jgi:hypothetical protein